ncbi:tetratricopeptide repeat protein [Chryseobacterium takakiae]|uniref:Tetratricopeptide repeat-containing protein n=1 Tax=Chryseobacterium takakiae TaxID=1302685 RepID=A0A1M4VJH0_9FLAO|nr:hypothetical protein [Chryseobacterium takakiae]SHE69013.1 hypothetical protein SAMN05444408_103140 [Chryseobacterium takakiae]
MKKTLLICFLVIGFCLNAQNYTEKDFKQTVSQINNAKTENDFDNAFQKLSRYTSTKPTEKWEAYYYAAVAMYLKAELQLKKAPSQDVSETNALARKYGKAAYSDKQNNAEADILLGLIALQRSQIGGTDAKNDLEAASQFITKAEPNAQNNPRLALLKAKFQERSGNKANAEKQFQNALKAFENNASSGSATWGRALIPSMN